MSLPIRSFINVAGQFARQTGKALAAEAPGLAAKGVATAAHAHLDKAAGRQQPSAPPAQPSVRNALALKLMKSLAANQGGPPARAGARQRAAANLGTDRREGEDDHVRSGAEATVESAGKAG